VHSDTWSGQVYDPLTDTSSLTNNQGVNVVISAPKVSFALSPGQKATCTYIFSTLNINIPTWVSCGRRDWGLGQRCTPRHGTG
jgi:hypothetical protein